MKTVGLLGGIGPESTIDYYRLLLSAYRDRRRDGSAPGIIINSIDMHLMLRLIAASEWAQVIEYLAGEVLKLARAGADVALLAANTPHIVFDEVQRKSPVPMISIVNAACQSAKRLDLKKLGLFGTRFTMDADFYPKIFSREGITLIVPGPESRAYIHEKYMSELGNGIFLPKTREELIKIARELKKREQIDGLVLAGTELPLVLRDVKGLGIPILDTTRIHVDAVAAEAWGL